MVMHQNTHLASLVINLAYRHTHHASSPLCVYQIRSERMPDAETDSSHLYRQHPCCSASTLYRCPSAVTYIRPVDAITKTPETFQ